MTNKLNEYRSERKGDLQIKEGDLLGKMVLAVNKSNIKKGRVTC